MENQPQSVFKAAVKPGLILGGFLVISLFGRWVIDPSWLYGMTAFWIMITHFLVVIAITVVHGRKYASNLPSLKWGKAVLFILVASSIGYFVSAMFEFSLYNIIDTELHQKGFDAQMESISNMMDKGWLDEKAAEMQYNMLKEQMKPENFSFLNFLLQWVFMTIWFGIVGLLTALFVRKAPSDPFATN